MDNYSTTYTVGYSKKLLVILRQQIEQHKARMEELKKLKCWLCKLYEDGELPPEVEGTLLDFIRQGL